MSNWELEVLTWGAFLLWLLIGFKVCEKKNKALLGGENRGK